MFHWPNDETAQHHFQTKLPTKFILAVLVIADAVFMVYCPYERYETGKQTEQAAANAQAETSTPAGVVDQVKTSVGFLINPVNNKPGTKALSLDESFVVGYVAPKLWQAKEIAIVKAVQSETTGN